MSFRNDLRDATRTEHDHLDNMLTARNIAQVADFACFIKVHLACFDAMSDAAQTGGYAQHLLQSMAQSLARDLVQLGTEPVQTTAALPVTIDQLAIDYMVAGSRLGSKVLKKRWLTAQDPVVRRADAYFGLHVDPTFWPSTCDALAAIPADSERANVITKDTRLLFQLFSDTYNRAVTLEANAQ